MISWALCLCDFVWSSLGVSMLLPTYQMNTFWMSESMNKYIAWVIKHFLSFLENVGGGVGREHRTRIRVWYTSNIFLCFHLLAFTPLYNQSSWDGWMVSPTQWTWVWVNSGSRWWTGRSGVLQSMGSQRVRYDWATEQNWTSLAYELTLLLIIIIQQKWCDEVAEDQLRLACSPWLFLLLALMNQLLCCELPCGRACVGKSWEHLQPTARQGDRHTKELESRSSQLSFEMKADLASMFLILFF